MKKTLIICALVTASLSAYSQGTVSFADNQSDVEIHIFAPQVATPGLEVQGDQGAANGSITGGVRSDLYANNTVDGNYGGTSTALTGTAATVTTGGSTVYTGGAIGNTLAGSATPAGNYNYNNGSDYTVELFAAPGFNVALSALSAVSQYTTTIATSSVNGGQFKLLVPSGDPGIPNTLPAGNATLALYAWYNNGVSPTGLIQTQLTAELTADQASGAPWGNSPTDNIAVLGGTVVGGISQTAPDLQGLESFNVVVAPEPSTIALGVIGASTLLFRRRK